MYNTVKITYPGYPCYDAISMYMTCNMCQWGIWHIVSPRLRVYYAFDDRGLWRRWERLNAARKAPGDVAGDGQGSADAIINAALEHFNNKMRLCRHRFDRYKKRGLLFRTVFQAAEKVLKVLTDVEKAHAVLFVIGEEAAAAAQKNPVRQHSITSPHHLLRCFYFLGLNKLR